MIPFARELHLIRSLVDIVSLRYIELAHVRLRNIKRNCTEYQMFYSWKVQYLINRNAAFLKNLISFNIKLLVFI